MYKQYDSRISFLYHNANICMYSSEKWYYQWQMVLSLLQKWKSLVSLIVEMKQKWSINEFRVSLNPSDNIKVNKFKYYRFLLLWSENLLWWLLFWPRRSSVKIYNRKKQTKIKEKKLQIQWFIANEWGFCKSKKYMRESRSRYLDISTCQRRKSSDSEVGCVTSVVHKSSYCEFLTFFTYLSVRSSFC